MSLSWSLLELKFLFSLVNVFTSKHKANFEHLFNVIKAIVQPEKIDAIKNGKYSLDVDWYWRDPDTE